MVEFEKPARRAAMPCRANESALTRIAIPYGATDVRRDVTAAGGRTLRRRLRCCAFPRVVGGSELLLFQLHDEGVERPVEDLSDVVRANRMTEQGLGVSQLVVGALAYRQLEEEAFNLPRGKLVIGPRGLTRGATPNLPRGKFAIGDQDRTGSRTSNLPRGKLVCLAGTNDRGHREALADQPLDLRFAPMRRPHHQLTPIVRSEMGRQQTDCGQMETTFSQRGE